MAWPKITILLFSIFLVHQASNAEETEFAILPGANYTSDAGFGVGIVGSLYGRNPEIKPYRFAVDLQVFATTMGQHSHMLRFDWLEAFGLPLRLRSRVGFIATTNANYCGEGSNALCEVDLTPEKHYYLVRYFESYGFVEGRWKLKPLPHQIELTGSYRGSYYQPGTWGDYTPYANSFFALQNPDGQKGYASVFEWGLMFDNRDQEASPTSGYWAELSLRESSPLWGSHWQYFGGNLSVRGYLHFGDSRRFVLAAQMIMDGIVGDAPLAEIVRVGNSLRFTAFGGADIGRGLRDQYCPGRLKLIKQLELRYRFFDFDIRTHRFNLVAVSFADFGMTSWRVQDFGSEQKKALVGFGSGLRVNWNTDFVVRIDLGLSPLEGYSPKVYFKVGNVF